MSREYRDIKDIAADIRTNLKTEFPKCKFAVAIERYSMGQSLHVSLMKAPFEAFGPQQDENGHPFTKTYCQLNEYTLRDKYAREMNGTFNNGNHLTEEAWDAMVKVEQIVNKENWDNSDSQTDYFDVNYYTHFQIGKWNKPFEVTQ